MSDLKKIKKIKPGASSETYEIVPERLQSNGYYVAPPSVSANATIALTTDINNATLTVTVNNVSQGTFTANSSTDTTINITTPQVKRYI